MDVKKLKRSDIGREALYVSDAGDSIVGSLKSWGPRQIFLERDGEVIGCPPQEVVFFEEVETPEVKTPEVKTTPSVKTAKKQGVRVNETSVSEVDVEKLTSKTYAEPPKEEPKVEVVNPPTPDFEEVVMSDSTTSNVEIINAPPPYYEAPQVSDGPVTNYSEVNKILQDIHSVEVEAENKSPSHIECDLDRVVVLSLLDSLESQLKDLKNLRVQGLLKALRKFA